MKIYKLQCLTEDGDIEDNGYYLNRENAEIMKADLDQWQHNRRYGIKQDIIEIETVD